MVEYVETGKADMVNGDRLSSKRFSQNWPVISEGFEIETEMTLHALDKRFRIYEIPIDYRDRPEGGESKLNTVSDGMVGGKSGIELYCPEKG